jgi:Predicted nucleotide kinase (related to CMP and AMP kinases)
LTVYLHCPAIIIFAYMRIAITGTHRVGKTTLAEKLQELFSDYEYYAEPYFELEEVGYIFPETPTADDYLAQLEYSIKQIAKSDNNAIFDRCPVDLLAYIQATDDTLNLQSIFGKVQNVMEEIDLLIFVPIEEPDIISCSVSELPELRYQVDDILRDLISDFDIEMIEVKGNLSERLNQIQNKIDQINSLYYINK